MIIRFKWSEIEARPDEVLELLKLAAGDTEEVKEVRETLKEIRNEVEAQKQKTDPVKKTKQIKSKPKTELDVPKMRALRKAGWTLANIADEMRCSPQTVANRLKEA